MAENIVFITATDYHTVYPPAAIPSPYSPPPDSTMAASSMSTTITAATTSPSSSPSPSPSPTSIPSGFASSEHLKPWSDHLASLMLAAIIFMALLLLSIISYAIYQRFRGRCHNCTANEAQLSKWQNGDLKVITKEMVKARESLNSTISYDMEKGEYQRERDTARKEALHALTRPESIVVKPSMWERAMGLMKSRSNRKPPNSLLPAIPHASSDDRFFTVEPATHVLHTPTPPYAFNRDLDHAYSPPSPSLYSRTTNRNIMRGGETQEEHYVHGPVGHDTESPQTYSEYLRDDWKQDKSVVAGALNIREEKKRSRTYGGLPAPYGWEDIDVNS